MNSSNRQLLLTSKVMLPRNFQESFLATCKQCNTRISPGDSIFHLRDGQMVHLRCKQIANNFVH